MIPVWDKDCIGFDWQRRNKSVGNKTAKDLVDWMKYWTLKDVLSFEHTSPFRGGDLHVNLVVRMHNSLNQQRYDYIVPLPGAHSQNDSAMNRFSDVLRKLLGVSPMSEWAYVRSAFLQIFQNATGGQEMYNCLHDQSASMQVTDALDVAKADYQCYGYIDKNMWEKWQPAYDFYEKFLFKPRYAWFIYPMDYEEVFAYWSGLLGALVGAFCLALATWGYFIYAACCSCVRLWKEQRRDAVPEEVVDKLVPVQHACNEESCFKQRLAVQPVPCRTTKFRPFTSGSWALFK